ncbi:MAG: hypothetical protein U0Q11_24315 [Vicinamibacterales bacterium]
MKRDPYRDEPVFAMRDVTHSAEAAPDCFRDEVAIDFPSVDGLVDRVRDSFLGGDVPDGPCMLTHEVRLSNGEARRGAIVPLELPIKGTCHSCGGRGEVWTEPCLTCCGSGDWLVHHPIRVSVPAGVSHGARFRFRVLAPHAIPVRVEVLVAVA